MNREEKIECIKLLTELELPLVRMAVNKASPKNSSSPNAKYRRIPCEKWKGILHTTRPPEMFHDCNVAVQTGHKLPDGRFLHILDVDLKKQEGRDTWKQIVDMQGDPEFWAGPMSETESGGIHLWFASEKQHNVFLGMMPGIDFLGLGALSFEPPSRFMENGSLCQQYKWITPPGNASDIPDIPQWILNELKIREIKAVAVKASRESNDAAFAFGIPEGAVAFIEHCLSLYTPDEGLVYQDWLRIGMALHDASKGSDAILAVFDAWGARVSAEKNGEYDEKKTQITWDSFGSRQDKVSYGTLVRLLSSHPPIKESLDGAVKELADVFSGVTEDGSSEVTSQNSTETAERGKTCEHLQMEGLMGAVLTALHQPTITKEGKIVPPDREPKIETNLTNGAIEITLPFQEMRRLDQAAEAEIVLKCRDYGRAKKIKPLTKESDVMRAVTLIADRAKYHPIRDYLNLCLEEYRKCAESKKVLFHMQGFRYPDGRCFREQMFDGINLQRGEDEQWFRTAMDYWLKGAICKVFFGYQNPMLVLQGLQGVGKSTLARALIKKIGTQYYYAGPIDPNDKDHKMKLAQLFVWEPDELGGTTFNADVNKLKSLLTLTRVNERPPYGRYVVDMDVVCSFLGTVNDSAFLRDQTGSRRFLVSRFHPVNPQGTINWLRGVDFDPNLVWGEVYHELMMTGTKAPILAGEHVHEAEERAEEVRQKDDLEVVLEDLLEIQDRGQWTKDSEWRLRRKDLRAALENAGIGMGRNVLQRCSDIIARLTGCRNHHDAIVQMNGERYFRKVRLRSNLVTPPSMPAQ